MSHHGKSGNRTGALLMRRPRKRLTTSTPWRVAVPPKDIIARYHGVAPTTLRLHFREERDRARNAAIQAVVQNMFRIASR